MTGPNLQYPAAAGTRDALSGAKVLVVGLGTSGRAVAGFLQKSGARVTAVDVQPESKLEGIRELKDLGVRVRTGGHNIEDFLNADLIVLSPGVPLDTAELKEAAKKGIEITGELELASMFITAPVIAVAGTNGKTTTTALIGHVLEAAGKRCFVGGNIGTPATEYVERGEKTDIVVLEVSSFNLETIKTFRPHIAVLLNITEDHLERYRDFDHYGETKFRLFMNQTAEDFSILNTGDPVICRLLKAHNLCGTIVPFTVRERRGEGLFMDRGDIVYLSEEGTREVYPSRSFALKGLHNMENTMAAVAAARLSSLSREEILEALKSFRGLAHRMEFLGEREGVAYINDSKSTNTGSLAAALRSLEGPVVLIAGGRDKGGDYTVLADEVKRKVRVLILMGEAKEKMAEALGGSADTVLVDSLEEAVKVACERALSGDTVLFSPACSSFDMFRDYKERGRRFRELVESL